ncbi:MAG: hypothetical protein U0Q16_19420 [Bryobacteraceae bacterium]
MVVALDRFTGAESPSLFGRDRLLKKSIHTVPDFNCVCGPPAVSSFVYKRDENGHSLWRRSTNLLVDFSGPLPASWDQFLFIDTRAGDLPAVNVYAACLVNAHANLLDFELPVRKSFEAHGS